MDADSVDVRSYPRDDAAFRINVQVAVASSWQTIRNAERLLAAVQAKLKEQYPHVQVRVRSPLAELPGDPTVIYAYRDGRAA